MSATSSTTSLASRLRSRAGTVLATVGLVAGGAAVSLAVASPAEAACTYDYRYHSIYYSYAEAETSSCAYWSNSYAQHGSSAIWSGWYSASSWARADSGLSLSHNAVNYFSL